MMAFSVMPHDTDAYPSVCIVTLFAVPPLVAVRWPRDKIVTLLAMPPLLTVIFPPEVMLVSFAVPPLLIVIMPVLIVVLLAMPLHMTRQPLRLTSALNALPLAKITAVPLCMRGLIA